ncbi:uncharacterized protein N0V89_007799 [Didymosphaeria variabile]|uniref:DNA polymerase delta subunit 4 n=1 Tax=Didymosphaeria variabile TaxID=1932322 RepID=A0A9W9CB44_9PLEO|nr:uncharacterized protein N0V89_007799 [Didymosphaeria variabile]KAJ4352451.1 hypothetical protein N0V89_007799 [Didymosphaeria variabile]
MPPKRRSTGATAKSNQSTLAFHGASNKVTKAGARATNAKKNLLSESTKKDEKPEVVDVKVEVEEAPTTAEAAIIEQTEQAQEQAQSTPEEDEARLVKPKQLQTYWKKQNTGSAPRYHQDDLSLEEKILRKFDMTGQFGPCVGIARLKRWKRAQRLGLEPPIEVLAVLLQEQDSKDKISVQRSVMDEILNSRNEIEA